MTTAILIALAIVANLIIWRIYRAGLNEYNRNLADYIYELETDNKRLASYCLELQRRLEHRNKPAIELERIERGDWDFLIEVNLN